MMKFENIKNTGSFEFIMSLPGEEKLSTNNKKKMNVLFFITDQQRADHLGYAGAKKIQN